jgi:filamentous hemagglutinin family protein
MQSSRIEALSRRSVLLSPIFLLVSLHAAANPTAPAVVTGATVLPSGGVVGRGQATLNVQGNVLTVTNSPGTIINWQSFSIGSGATTNFVQPSASSAVLNRVVGPNISSISGRLLSNGHVFLTNPNGVLINSGAQINAASFTAMTSAISDADFLAGNTSWSGDGSFLSAEGALNISGGFLAMSGSGIEITGTISFAGTSNLTAPAINVSGGIITDHTLTLGNTSSSNWSDFAVNFSAASFFRGSNGGGTLNILSTSSTPINGSISIAASGITGTTIGGSGANAGTLVTDSSSSSGAGNITVTGASVSNAASISTVAGLTITTAGSQASGNRNGTVTLTNQQGSTASAPNSPATTSAKPPAQSALGQATPIQPSASVVPGAVTVGRSVVAAATVVGIQPPVRAPLAATLTPRSTAVGATISLQKREPLF